MLPPVDFNALAEHLDEENVALCPEEYVTVLYEPLREPVFNKMPGLCDYLELPGSGLLPYLPLKTFYLCFIVLQTALGQFPAIPVLCPMEYQEEGVLSLDEQDDEDVLPVFSFHDNSWWLYN